MVHTKHEPWYTDSGAGKAGGSGGWHALTVTGYDAATKRVAIDNTWGKSVDHTAPSNHVAVSRVFDSMKPPVVPPAPLPARVIRR